MSTEQAMERFAHDASRVHTLTQLRAAMVSDRDDRGAMDSWGFTSEQLREAIRLAIVYAIGFRAA